jgi:pimeloyl-ACP methyl ester carboxylesterase
MTDALFTLSLNGEAQWVLKRTAGHCRSTLLLWLHGGPGSTLMPFANLSDPPLLRLYDVAHWDQRGSGKSFRPGASSETLTLATFEADLASLLAQARVEWGYTRIVCIGHSWGSLLGLRVCVRYPGAMDAFIGVGVVVDDAASQVMARKYCLREATLRKDVVEHNWLSSLTNEPLVGGARLRLAAGVARFGGVFGSLAMEDLGAAYAASPFKHSSEEPTQQTSVEKLVEALWPSILAYDFVDSVRHANCPLLFIQGELDQATPAQLLEEKLEVLPKEGRPGVVRLSGQGHFPFWENAEGFAGHVKKFVESL